MKKILFIVIASISFMACSESNEKKAEKLIKNEMNKLLVNFDTYEPIETVIDSAFAPMTTADLLNKYLLFPNQVEMMLYWQKEAETAYEMMQIYQPVSSYSRYEYDQYKEKYESACKKAEEMESHLKSFNDSVEKLIKEEPIFNGYFISHKFRYVTKYGDKAIGTFMFLVNQDISSVEYIIDAEDERFKKLSELVDTHKIFNH